MHHSFCKVERIKKRKDFDTVFKHRNVIRSHSYTCYFDKTDLPMSRIGIVVKKRYKTGTRNSVQRNYEKRIIREIYRQNKDLLSNSYDIIFLLKNFSSSFLDKQKELVEILERISKQ